MRRKNLPWNYLQHRLHPYPQVLIQIYYQNFFDDYCLCNDHHWFVAGYIED